MRHALRRSIAEALGSLFLATTVIGSGIMAERLCGGNQGLALLCNVLAICAFLGPLIFVLAPISGAHLNPAVTMIFFIAGEMPLSMAIAYVLAQIAGAIPGAWLAHAMFDEPIFQMATQVRTGSGQWLSEAIASFGLIATIVFIRKSRAAVAPLAVTFYVMAACWFTASAAFLNPALTLARSLTDTFTGIRPVDAPGFIAAQLAGALAGLGLYRMHSRALRSDSKRKARRS
jgi:glycerol uptake facilitator-like aquaporin